MLAGVQECPLRPRPSSSALATVLFPDGPHPGVSRAPSRPPHALHAGAQLPEGGGRRHLTPATLGVPVGWGRSLGSLSSSGHRCGPARPRARSLALADAPVQGSEGPRPPPLPRRPPASTARCEAAAASGASASASWAGLSPSPPSALTPPRAAGWGGCTPAAQGAPAAPPPTPTFPGGPGSATPRRLTPQTGLHRGLPPPQPAPQRRSSDRPFFSERPPGVLCSLHTATGHGAPWELTGLQLGAPRAQVRLLPAPPPRNNNVSR